jgi:hypothetical protein
MSFVFEICAGPKLTMLMKLFSCDDGVEQVISISNATAFPVAGLRV